MHLDVNRITRILIIQPSRLGDCVFCLPPVSALRKRFPNAYIAWLVDDRCQDIVAGNPDLNEVIIFERNRLLTAWKKKNFGAIWRFAQELKQTLQGKQFDLSIDFHGLFKSGVLAYLSRAKYRIGSYNTVGMRELSYLFSKEIPVREQDSHVIDRHLAVVRYLGGSTETAQFPISVSAEDTKFIRELLVVNGISVQAPLVVIHPGAGWLTRRWYQNRFASVADALIEKHQVKIAIIGGRVGGKGEVGLAESIIRTMRYPAVNLTDRLTVKQLVALLHRATLFIGNDAGPMHIASAIGTPIVAIFGPTNPSVNGPYRKNAVVVRKDLPCSFCRKKKCRTLECMERITVSEVVSAAEKLLSNKYSE
jgi:predicted lipopolysaccharide heptosyltransferase III